MHAARLHKHQREACDSKSGWGTMLTILIIIIKERGLRGSIRERHTTLSRQFVSFVISLKPCQQFLGKNIFSPRTWNLKLVTDQSSSFTVGDINICFFYFFECQKSTTEEVFCYVHLAKKQNSCALTCMFKWTSDFYSARFIDYTSTIK